MRLNLLTSRRWWQKLTSGIVVSFGILATLPQLYLALWPQADVPRGSVLVAIAATSIATGLIRAHPKTSITRDFERPQVSVTVKIGDLFDEASHLVIGFNDTFDTDTTDDLIISRSSVQGQFLERIYEGDRRRLNTDIRVTLSETSPAISESPSDKPHGKLDRYKIGTVAVLRKSSKIFFCIAYGRMQNNLVVRSSADDLWRSLDHLWESVDASGRREPVAMPVVGSEMARINHLDREVLLRMILLSFVAHSRQSPVTKELTIAIHPKDAHLVDMLALQSEIGEVAVVRRSRRAGNWLACRRSC
ncbi:macro domain-containing protein [Streptomyces violascens]|uniref:macro domain-containing protein n=1 Tax=Streptomyces violascens TaxID=67381 RepID=UPI0037A670E7